MLKKSRNQQSLWRVCSIRILRRLLFLISPLSLRALALILPLAVAAVGAPSLRVPDGFVIERAAAETALKFPMFACFDDAGHLYVAESSGLDLYAELQQQTRRCRLSILEDRDGNGVFESARIFAEQLVFPMGLAWRDGKLYVADPPDLITLEDTDGDGRADRRTVILSGFGHRDNGSLHGLSFGPDGWLYLTMGEPDGFALKRGDGSVVSGKAGALLRCRPDGSDIEVIASGFENLVEAVFLPGGEVIGTLNWYSLPEAGVRDALVHLIEGGRYPLQHDAPVLPEFFHGETLPALSLYPAVALSGMDIYRGNAFPGWSGHVFTAQFNARKVVRHELIQTGSTFRSLDHDFITTEDPDVHFSDVLEDADGSLIAVDTGSWYLHHCPTGRIRSSPASGGLWRARHKSDSRPADPRGQQLDWQNPGALELARRLDDSRPVVRERAQVALGRSPVAAAALADFLRANHSEPARIAAAWALGNIPAARGLGVLRELVRAADDPLATLAARILARHRDHSIESSLLLWLTNPKPAWRMAAAEALANCGSTNAIQPLLLSLAADPDPFFEHALLYSLHRVATVESLRKALGHLSPAIQRAALILLDQETRRALSAEDLVARLDAADPKLSATARRLLQRHSEWATSARAVLARLLTAPAFSHGQGTLFRSLVKQLAADPDSITAIAGSLSPGVVEARQLRALDAMDQAGVRVWPAVWSNALAAAFTNEFATVRHAAVRCATTQPAPAWDEKLKAVAGSADETIPCRLDALRAIARRLPEFNAIHFALLERCFAPTNAASLRLSAMETFAAGHPTAAQTARVVELVQADGLITPAQMIEIARHLALSPAQARTVVEFARMRLEAGWTLPQESIPWLTNTAAQAGGGQLEKLQLALASLQQDSKQQLEAMLPLLTAGDALRGQRIFEDKAACAACHRIGQTGGMVGPDLTKIGAVRSGRDLLESVLLPSATFAQGFESFTATLSDGETLTGVRVRTNDGQMILRDASGHETRLPADAKLQGARTSLMPEGLLNALNPDEIRDLFAYLQSLK